MSESPPPFVVQPQLPPTPPPNPSRRNRWIVIGVLTTVVLLLCCAGSTFAGVTYLSRRVESTLSDLESGLEDPDGVVPSLPPIDPAAVQLDDALLEIGDFDMTITRISFETTVDDQSPSDGSIYAVMDVRATNRSRRSQVPYDTLFDSYAQDAANQRHDCCEYSSSGASLYDPVASGDTVDLQLVYEVPGEGEPVYWVYQDPLDEQQVITRLR